MIASQFKSGATFFVVGSGDDVVPLTISALFKKVNEQGVFGLANQNEKLVGCKDRVYADEEKQQIVGKLSTSEVFPSGDGLGALFNVIKFDTGAVKPIEDKLVKVAYTKDVSYHIWRPRPMRVRKTVLGQTDFKQSGTRAYYKGLLVGDVKNPAVGLRNQIVTLRRAARAKSSGGKAIASDEDGGALVLSKSKALFGFVVGSADDEILIMPAEQLSKDYDIQFVAPRLPENSVRLLDKPEP